MTRLLSGLALASVAVALIWFLSSAALLAIAMAVATLAFTEYARIVDAIGARVPWWSTWAATLLAVTMVPFPWLPVESVLAGALMLDRKSVV